MSDSMENVEPVRPDPTKTIVLDEPITVGARVVSELNLKEPTAIQVRDAQKVLGNAAIPSQAQIVDYQIELVRLVTGIPKQMVEMIKYSDLVEAAQYVQSHINFTQKIG